MITAKERKQRHAMRVLRIEVLDAMHELENERCDNCSGDIGPNPRVSVMRCGCAASVKIREMANSL